MSFESKTPGQGGGPADPADAADVRCNAGRLAPLVGELRDDLKIQLGRLAEDLQRIASRLDRMNTQIWSLRDDMPVLVAEALEKARRRLD